MGNLSPATPIHVALLPATAMGSERRCRPAACPEHTLQGTVVSATGTALPDARVYLEGSPPVLLARSDAHGRFMAAGLCEGTAGNVSAQREGFAPALAPIVSNGSGVAVAHVVMQRLGEHDGAGLGGGRHPSRVLVVGGQRYGRGGCGSLHPLPPSSPAEKPYMVLHPKAKVRVAGQEVTFCCKAAGTPVPKKYYW